MNEKMKLDFDALDALLETERSALLKGDFEVLTSLLPKKEALIDALSDVGAEELPELRELDVKVRRNQLLLDGALEGIREVAARLAEMRRMRNGLATYGSDGQKQNINVRVDHTLERRA